MFISNDIGVTNIAQISDENLVVDGAHINDDDVVNSDIKHISDDKSCH
jgi:hypothetical protein